MGEIARDLLRELGNYPRGSDRNGQMDQIVVDRCAALAVKSDLRASDIKTLLDDCAYGSLCTDFVMRMLDIAWRDSNAPLPIRERSDG